MELFSSLLCWLVSISGPPSGLVALELPTDVYKYLIFPIHYSCPAKFVSDLTTLIIFGGG
jgi:hypothetical protein